MERSGLLESIPTQMKAVVVTDYGGLEKLEERKVRVPLPNENEVLVKIHAWHVRLKNTLRTLENSEK